MAEVRFKEVSKIYPNGTHAVDNVSLDVKDGEFLVLVGPSGCGKSTLIRMLAGLETQTKGELFIGEKSVDSLPPQKRNTAMVFQNYALYPHMTVRQNLGFPLKMQNRSREDIAKKITETSKRLGLDDLLDRKPKQLSGGQRQRVAMGRAIIREPEVYLMDEPLSNLDAKLRMQIRTDIATLQAGLRTTTIYVTHDQVEAMTLGHRICVLRDGKVQQLGTPSEIYDTPANLFVGTFFGSPGMNIVPATLREETGGRFVIDICGQVMTINAEPLSPFELEPEKPYYLGFRPEVLAPSTNGREAENTLKLTCKNEEHLGHETIMYATLSHGGDEHKELIERLGRLALQPEIITARIRSQIDMQKGEDVLFGFSSGYLHIFDIAPAFDRIETLCLK